jgi:hypothetical protein
MDTKELLQSAGHELNAWFDRWMAIEDDAFRKGLASMAEGLADRIEQERYRPTREAREAMVAARQGVRRDV